MLGIKYIRLFEQLKYRGYDLVRLTCCDSSFTNFKLLRVQIQGDILCSDEGVRLKDGVHDQKCMGILKLAKENFCDLLLLPEYCISYTSSTTSVKNCSKEL